MVENIKNTIPQPEEFPEKYLELDEKTSEFPVPEEVWEEVINLAKEEEGKELGNQGLYGKIPLGSLLDLAKCVRAENDPIRRYELLTNQAPDGQVWFDVLNGLRSLPAQAELMQTVSKREWGKALDLGTGTGEMADKIKPYCSALVGIDRVKLLLDLAQERETEKQDYVLADALKNPFKKDCFELVVSSGLTGSFTKENLKEFIDELKIIIRPGGSYIESFLLNQQGLSLDSRKKLANAKSILADMIVDEASGKAEIKDKWSFKDMAEFFKEAGFEMNLCLNKDQGTGVVEFIKK